MIQELQFYPVKFHRYFRMSVGHFEKLPHQLAPHLQSRRTYYRGSIDLEEWITTCWGNVKVMSGKHWHGNIILIAQRSRRLPFHSSQPHVGKTASAIQVTQRRVAHRRPRGEVQRSRQPSESSQAPMLHCHPADTLSPRLAAQGPLGSSAITWTGIVSCFDVYRRTAKIVIWGNSGW